MGEEGKDLQENNAGGENTTPETSDTTTSSNTEQQKQSSFKEKASKAVQNFLKKGGAAKHSMLAAIAPILGGIFAGLVILIIAIGLIMFFVTMPGMVMEQLKALAGAIGDAIASWFGQNSAEQIDDEQIYGVMDYLEQMGYDLKGDGFLTDYVGTDPSGVEKEDDVISNAESDFIFAYLVSENYLYTIKNFNTTTEHWWEAVWDHLSALWSDNLGNRTGMLVFFHENGDEIGSTSDNAYDAWERGSIEVDAESKKLSIKKGWTNNAMSYNLDGWTGRYGMPIDFLISVHLATMMPDLAYDMYDSFKTEIKILLHETSGNVDGTYKTDSGSYVKYQDVAEAINGFAGKNIFSKIWNAVDEWGLNAGEAQKLLDLGIIPDGHNPSECGCEVSETYTYDGKTVYSEPAPEENTEDEENSTDSTENNTENNENNTDDGLQYYYYTYDDNGIATKQVISKSELSEDNKTSTLTKLGESCKKYWKNAVKYMKKANDYDFSTYVPYIENVTNHWYRDVYFITNEKINEFVDYDYEYEAMMKERWTLYETYTYEENPEKAGDYKLYAIDKDGEYATNESDIENYDSSKFEKSGNYYLFTGTQNEANEAKIKVSKKAEMVAMDSVYEDLGWIKLSDGVYSAYSVDENTTPDYQQVYKSDSGDASEIYNEADEETKKVLDRIYSVVQIGNVTQTGEGQRTETNSEIKKMFLQNRYFRYDGSAETAEIITALRDKVYASDDENRYGPIDESKIKDGDGNDIKYELNFDDEKYTSNAENGEYKLSDYTANVTLNQDSLNSFSMLENTHTLDADYIYRDFKELIVELGYFTKEELTDETPRLLQFLVPDIGSGGYPNRVIDKREQEFGTMIHSEGDIKANEKATLLELISEMGSEIPEDINQQQAAEVETATNGIINAKKQNTTEVGEIKPNPGNKKVSDVSIDEFLATTREMCEYINKEGYDYCVLVTDAGNGEQQCHHAPVHGNPCGLPRTFLESQSSVSKHNFCCATLVSWALQNVGVMPDEAHLDGADSLAEWIVENLDPEQVNVGEELKPGDILCYEGHIDLVGEEVDGGFVKYNGGHYTEAGSVEFEGSSCIQKISGWPDDSRIKFALRLNWGDSQEGDTYEGYEGNEAVVSPVTGILLEYGTYTDEDIDSVSGEEYRTNVDLKYGPASALPGAEGEDGEEATNNSTGTSENTNTTETPTNGEPQVESETEGGEIVADKVGYAKILVLDAENYQKLESKTGNRWQSDSLVKISEAKTSTNNEAALETDKSSARYLEKLETEEQMDEEHENWNNLDKTIYGYKEFAESYEKYGIAGQIIYIDGFTCELPDESLSGGEEGSGETAEEGETAGGEIAEQIPEGEKLTIDSFKKVTAANLTGTEEPSEEDVLQSKYEKEDEYKLASKKATDKLNAESVVKDEANSSIYLEGEDLIFIKEGTVIGRTMTDREVVEKVRKDPPHPYEYYRPDASTSSTSGGATGDDAAEENEEENEDKLIGNYIRIIMRDLDDTVVENVEDYMKLDDGGKESQDVEFEQLAYYLGCLEEGFYESMDNGDSYGVEVLKDGAGNTTAFGLTKAVASGKVAEVYPSFASHLAAGSVPKEEAQDVFIIVLEAAKEEIESKLNNKDIDENYMFALIDLHHASPSECYDVIDILNTNGTLTVEDFENNWGSNENYGELLRTRGHNRGILATEGRFLLYQEGSEGDEVIFDTETPWTEFCDGGGTYELTKESSGFYHIEKDADDYVPH